MKAIEKSEGLSFEWVPYDLGGERYKKSGEILPDSVLSELGKFDAIYLGAIGHPDVDMLSWWSELTTVPAVAIGGITPDNCPPLVRAGADFIAVLSAVWNHAQGPAEAVKQFNQIIAEAAPAES